MTRTTMFLQLLMCWLLIEPSIQAALQGTNGDSTISTFARTRVPRKKIQNICDFEQREAPIFCSCNAGVANNGTTEVICLILSDKLKIDDPTWEFFSGSQSSIEVLSLDVTNSGILNYIPINGIKSLKKLRKFTVKYANLSVIESHSFCNMPSLMEINLDTCDIKNLKEKAFDKMDQLNLINLHNNNITEINRDVFVNLGSLSKLFLQKNKISVIHDKSFKFLSNLGELDLSENSISVITTGTFIGLKNLERLNLAKNSLEKIDDKIFAEMPELKVLDLGQNRIQFISEHALHGMRNLMKLDLSENALVKLEKDFLYGAPTVNFLDLRGNQLKTMTFDNVKPIVTNLYNETSYLYLDDNKLICDCKLAWIWGLRNETKNPLLRHSLDLLNCFLEIQNTTFASNDVEDNTTEKTIVDGDESEKDEENDTNTEEYDNYTDSTSKPESVKLQTYDGKQGIMKHLNELQLEQLLPCTEQSLEDQVEPSGSSSRRENSPITSSSSKVQFILGSQILAIALSFII